MDICIDKWFRFIENGIINEKDKEWKRPLQWRYEIIRVVLNWALETDSLSDGKNNSQNKYKYRVVNACEYLCIAEYYTSK